MPMKRYMEFGSITVLDTHRDNTRNPQTLLEVDPAKPETIVAFWDRLPKDLALALAGQAPKIAGPRTGGARMCRYPGANQKTEMISFTDDGELQAMGYLLED